MRGCIVAGGALALAVLAAAAANAAPAKKAPARTAPAKKPAAKPAPSQAAEAKAVFAQLKKAEASVTTGRLTVQEVQRQGDLPDKKASPRETAQHAPLTGQRREILAFSGADWRRDLTIMDEQTHPVAHILVGVEGNYVEGVATVKSRSVLILDIGKVLTLEETSLPPGIDAAAASAAP